MSLQGVLDASNADLLPPVESLLLRAKMDVCLSVRIGTTGVMLCALAR